MSNFGIHWFYKDCDDSLFDTNSALADITN